MPPIDVVLIDDAPEVRALVEQQLRLSGDFVVTGAGATGADAIALAAQQTPSLLLLDVSMADMDGLEVLPRILEVSPTTKVVMLSGFGGDLLAETSMRLGAAAFIEKDVAITSLPARLRAVLGVEAAGSPIPVAPDLAHEGLATTALDSENVLVEHMERFRTAVEEAAIGMATLTLSGSLVRVNRALTEIIERPVEWIVGRRYDELVPAETSTRVQGAIRSVAAGEEQASEVEHELNGPTPRWVRSTFASVRDGSGRPLYIFVQVQDMTGRREAAANLRASEERFRLLVEGVRDYAIFMLDEQGRVTTWNLGAERMKGYRAEEVIGQHFRIFYPPAVQASGHPEYELDAAIRRGRYEEEGWRVRKDGSQFWADVVITALFDADGNLAGFAKVTRDVTEQRVASDARARAAIELAEANSRLRAQTDQTAQFLAITAHELQSPIAVMTGAADILLEHWRTLDDDGREEILKNMSRGGVRLRHLLDDLLTASRLEAGSFVFTTSEVELGSVLSEAVSQLGLGDLVGISCADDLIVLADRTRVMQVVTNLLSNAVKYGEAPIRIEARPGATMVEVRVCDAGAGVAPEFADRLFEKFTQGGKGRALGTGLGLFIVRELCRGQGGDAWYEGGDGQPTCFAFALPASC